MVEDNIYTGQKVVLSAGTSELIVALNQRDVYITIKAKGTNSGNIYIGGDNMVNSSNGYILNTNEEITIYLQKGNEAIYIDADISNEGISYIYWSAS